MADHVRDRFLQDPVCGAAHGARQRRRRRGCFQRDVESGVARLGGELVDLSQAGLRHAAVAVVTEYPEDGAHLPQRPGTGLLDGLQRFACLFRSLVEHVRGDPGLDVDDRDGVRDRVVDLARDAEPFGVDPRPRLLLAGPFRQLGTLLSFGRDDPPGPDGLAQGRAHDRRTDAEEHPADGGVWLDAACREQPPDGEHPGTHTGDHQ